MRKFDFSKVKNLLNKNEIETFFEDNEVKNNIQNGYVLLAAGLMNFVTWLLFVTHIWHTDNMKFTSNVFLPLTFVAFFFAFICKKNKGNGYYIKWILVIIYLFSGLLIGLYSSATAFIILLIPVIISCGYYNPNFTLVTSFLSFLCMVGTSLLKTFIKPIIAHDVDVRFIVLPKGTTLTFNNGRLFKTLINFNYDKIKYLNTEINGELIPILFIFILICCLCVYLAKQGKMDIENQRDAVAERGKIELELTEHKTQTMISQIQPHFMFNVLNSIYELCDEDPEIAQEAIDEFSTYLRTNVDTLSTKRMIPIGKELEHIKTYVFLEKLRFGDRVNMEYDMEVNDFYIPPLSLQPLVENAIKHGICKKREGGTVKITTKADENYVYIIVSDDGVGFEPEKIGDDGREHVGMKNIAERLELLTKAQFNIETELNVGTTITIKIPKEKAYEDSTIR